MSRVDPRSFVLVALPPGLSIDDGLLGTSWPVTGGSVACTLVMPQRPPGTPADWWGPGRGLRPPDLGRSTDAIDALWWHLLDVHPDAFRWGAVHRRSPDGRVVAAAVEHAVAVLAREAANDDDSDIALVQDMSSSAATWLSLVTDWLEVLTRQVIATPIDGQASAANTFGIRVDSATGDPLYFGQPRVLVIPSDHLVEISVEEWTRATQLVASDVRPPLSHLMLRDARTAYMQLDGRRAVIDAATACEVALADAIRFIWHAPLPTRSIAR